MSTDNASDTPTAEQKGKGKAPIDEPVQEDRVSLQDSTYGTGGAHPTPTTPLFPPSQEQNRPHQGGLTVVEEDEKLEHFPVENASSRYPTTIIGPAVEGEDVSSHESPEVHPADDVDDEKSIATNDWAAPGCTTRFRPIDWRRQRSLGPNAQRAVADRNISPTSRDVETAATIRPSMRLGERGSAESRARHQAIDEDLDKLPSSDALGEVPVDHRAGSNIRLSIPGESSSSGKTSSNTLSSSPCRRHRSGRTRPARRPSQRASRPAATAHISDHHPRVGSSNARSAPAHQQSVAMSDPQSLLSALNATPMRVTRSRSNAALQRLSVTHSEVVRARSEERHKGLQENEIPPKARAKLGIQAPVRQVPNPADPTSHLPPAFAGQNALGSQQGNSMPRIVFPRRFKPPAPAEVAARGRRQTTPNTQIPPATATQHQTPRQPSRSRTRVERWVYGENPPQTPREPSRSRTRVERWVFGENHPVEFHEDDEERRLLQEVYDGTRDELQPFASAEGFLNPTSNPPTSEEGRKKKKKKERKKAFWANCRRKAVKKLLRRKSKKS